MRVKVCGITNLPDGRLACQLGAHAIGFIFYRKSKRYIDPEEVNKISAALPAFVLKVGVFVNEEITTINDIAAIAGLNAVQLHGEETPEYITQMQLPVIKSFRVDGDFDYDVIRQYKNCAILLDAKSTKGYGGTGESFDYSKIPQDLKHRIILAGGVGQHNLEQIYKEVHPEAVDLSSAIESEPGKKDHAKMKAFFTKYNETIPSER